MSASRWLLLTGVLGLIVAPAVVRPFWITLLKTIPAPKKTLSTMPMAASSLVRVQRQTKVTSATPTRPVANAPASMAVNCQPPAPVAEAPNQRCSSGR